jgi:hypothetical protein
MAGFSRSTAKARRPRSAPFRPYCGETGAIGAPRHHGRVADQGVVDAVAGQDQQRLAALEAQLSSPPARRATWSAASA